MVLFLEIKFHDSTVICRFLFLSIDTHATYFILSINGIDENLAALYHIAYLSEKEISLFTTKDLEQADNKSITLINTMLEKVMLSLSGTTSV